MSPGGEHIDQWSERSHNNNWLDMSDSHGKARRHSFTLDNVEKRRRNAVIVLVLAMLTLGCSAADFVSQQRVTPSPPPVTRTLVPTFTPSPDAVQSLVIVTPPANGAPGVIIVPPGMDPSIVLPESPTESPVQAPTEQAIVQATEAAATATTKAGETPTHTPLPTFTPQPTATQPTPTHTPPPTVTPYVMVQSGLISLRTGPGLEYPQVARLGPDIPIAITGANPDGLWLQLCCISGESLWAPTQHVTVYNDISQLPHAVFQPPPPPTASPTHTVTPTPTPTPTGTPFPFELAIGPQFFPTNNEILTLWTKLFIGTPPSEVAAPGYTLTVLFEGFERPNAAGPEASGDAFEYSAPPGSGSRVPYNYKYEYIPPDPLSLDSGSDLTRLDLLGTGTWTVFVSDGAGNRLSEPVSFTTAPENPNREIYLGWARVR